MEVIGDKEEAPIGRQSGRDGLALDWDAANLFSAGNVDYGDGIIKAVANEQSLFIQAAQDWSHGGVARGNGCESFARTGADNADAALRRCASHIEARAVCRECQTRG